MEQRLLGRTGLKVSAVTLGGGGIGMVWGPTTDDECIETLKQAVAWASTSSTWRRYTAAGRPRK